MKNPKVLELDFSKLPDNIGDARIDGQIIVLDNLGQTINPDRKRIAERYCFPTHSDLTIIALCTKGEAHFRINVKEEELSPNKLLIILQGCIFEVMQVSEDFEGAILLMNPKVFSMTEDAVVGMSLRQYFTMNHSVLVSPDNINVFLDVYSLLKRAMMEREHPFRYQIVQKYCQILGYLGYNAFLQSPYSVSVRKNRKEEIFDRFIRTVEKHYMHERRIRFYADEMCLSPKYLSAVVKEVSQKFANDWIDEYVILEAKALLKQGGITIQQISDQLHFPNQSFFGRYFKHHTGYSPKEYRNL